MSNGKTENLSSYLKREGVRNFRLVFCKPIVYTYKTKTFLRPICASGILDFWTTYWVFGLLGCWAFGLLGLGTFGLSDFQGFGHLAFGLQRIWTCGLLGF